MKRPASSSIKDVVSELKGNKNQDQGDQADRADRADRADQADQAHQGEQPDHLHIICTCTHHLMGYCVAVLLFAFAHM